jgi:hypothetical protein
MPPAPWIRATRSRALAAAAVATGMAALSLSLGAPGASAATRQPSAPAGLTWHKLALRNGWTPGSLRYGAGTPSWAMANGIIYLSGGLRQKAGSHAEVVAVLPRSARPARTVVVDVYTGNNTYGSVNIVPDGLVLAASSPPSNVRAFTSLAGVTFPAARTSRHKLTLLNGWQPVAPPYTVKADPPGYTVSGGVVYLSGGLLQPSPGSQVFARLPKPVRPSHVLYITVYTGNSQPGTLEVRPDGTMDAFNGEATSFTSLYGVSFPAASARSHPLALRDDWVSSQPVYNSGNPAYSVIDGVVHLSGSLHQTVHRQGAFAVLPRGARPAHFMYINVYQDGGVVGFVLVYPDGKAYLSGDNPSAWQAYSSLASVAFPAA